MAVNVNIPKPTYTKSDVGLGNVDNTSDLNKPISTATQTALDGKVDKVTGKGLSENDFTNTLKTKLDGIQDGAEVNVNADWNATSGDAQILNKPTIPSVTGLVPYTGATTDVDLGNNDLNAEGIKIKGTAGNGHLNMKHQSSNPTAGGQETVIFAGSDGEPRFKNDGNAVEQFASRQWVGLQGFITNVITALGFTPVPQTRTVNGLNLASNITLTTANINDSTNKRYVTDAQSTVIGNTSGTNTGDQDLSGLMVKANNLSDLTNAATARTNLGLGTLATQSGTFSGTSSGTNTGDETKSSINSKLERQLISKATDQTTSSTTAVAVTDMQTSTLTTGKYAVNGTIRVSSNSTTGIVLGVVLPSGATMALELIGRGSTSANTSRETLLTSNTLSSITFANVNGNTTLSLNGTITIDATSGNVSFIFAKVTSGVAGILAEGTQLKFEKI